MSVSHLTCSVCCVHFFGTCKWLWLLTDMRRSQDVWCLEEEHGVQACLPLDHHCYSDNCLSLEQSKLVLVQACYSLQNLISLNTYWVANLYLLSIPCINHNLGSFLVLALKSQSAFSLPPLPLSQCKGSYQPTGLDKKAKIKIFALSALFY